MQSIKSQSHEDQLIYEEIIHRVVAVADPEQIIIFDSRARGQHRAGQ